MHPRHKKKPEDYYDLLGVAKTASKKEIVLAYRRLARKEHPDVSNRFDAADRFAELNAAYKILKDPEKREEYNTLLRERFYEKEVTKPALDKLTMLNNMSRYTTLRDIIVIVVCTALVIIYLFSTK